MCTASIYKLKENGYIRLRMIKRYCHKDDKCENVWRPLKKLGEMRTAAAFRCLSQRGGNSIQTGVVWGAVRGDTTGHQCCPTQQRRGPRKFKEKRNLFNVVP